jgi:phage tail sheath gpL-like
MTVSIPTLSNADVIPGIYKYISYGSGPVSGSGDVLSTLVVGHADPAKTTLTTDALYGPDTAVPLNGTTDAESLFGARSEICEMYRQVLRINPSAVLYAYVVPEAGGGAKDIRTITITTNASSTGVVQIRFADAVFDVAITSGDTPTVQAGKVVSAINSNPRVQAVASNVAGVVSITATHASIRGTIPVLSVNNSTTLNTDQTLYGSTWNINKTASGMVTGSGTESYTNMLTNLAGRNFYWIALPDHCASTTNLAAIGSYLTTEALPINNNIQKAFAVTTDSTSTNAVTAATTLNNVLFGIAWAKSSYTTPAKLCAQLVGAISAGESQSIPTLNWNDYGARRDSAGLFDITFNTSVAVPTRAEKTSCLASGVSLVHLIGKIPGIIKLITTYCLNGTQPDYRVRDWHIPTVLHAFMRDLSAACYAIASGKVIKDEPRPGTRIPENCVVPSNLRGAAVAVVKEYVVNGLLENEETVLSSIVVERQSNPDNRMAVVVSADVAAILNQLVVRVDHVG